ncbi:MAG TPA: TetR/AcrR family transcriptional regulator [Thermoleophilaceae bacterium]|nr:TetR/AcrR family transcriptional regulator [Thermoleophilaceae bacterium]
MSTGYESNGRTRQKARTRAALLQAARELLASGPAPTVEQAADRAGISRTTAYRYFANQRQLVAATYPQIEARSLLDSDAPEDPAARLEIVLERMTGQLTTYEPELRAQLRLSLEGGGEEDLPLRQGRAIGWIEEALAPLGDRLDPGEVRQLAVAIRAACGIEPLVWLTDVAGLSRPRAVRLMRSSARTLLEAAIRRS